MQDFFLQSVCKSELKILFSSVLETQKGIRVYQEGVADFCTRCMQVEAGKKDASHLKKGAEFCTRCTQVRAGKDDPSFQKGSSFYFQICLLKSSFTVT